MDFQILKELFEIKQLLEKTKNDEEIIHLLKRLEQFKTTISIDQHKHTKISITVNRLTKHSNPDISEQAKEIYSIWKKIFLEEKGKVKPVVAKVESASPTSLKRKREESFDDKTEKKETPVVSPDKHHFRKKIEGMFCKTLIDTSQCSDEDKVICIARADELEQALFAHGDEECTEKYKAKFRSLQFNLKKNILLCESILDGSLLPEKLMTMDTRDMAPEELKNARKDVIKNKTYHSMILKAEATTDQFLCGKCKQRKCTYFQLQTRSADEPMTTFVTCVNCDNRWKFC